MTVTVTLNEETGSATLVLATDLQASQPLRLALQNTRTMQYLTPAGWVSNRKTIAEATQAANGYSIELNPATVAFIAPGTPLLLEEIFINLRLPFTWPMPQPAPAPDPQAVPIVRDQPVAKEEPPSHETLPNEPDATTAPIETAHRPTRAVAWRPAAAGLLVGMVISYGLLLTTKDAHPPVPQQKEQAGFASTSSSLTITQKADSAELTALRTEREKLQDQLNAANHDKQNLQMKLAMASNAAPDASTAAIKQQLREALENADHLEQVNQILREQLASRPSPEAVEQPDRDKELQEAERKLQYVMQVNQNLRRQIADQRVADTIKTEQQPNDLNDIQSLQRANWLAAAVDRSGTVNAVANQVSAEAAENLALKACGGKKKGCRLVGSYTNTCFALSRPSGQGVIGDNWWEGIESDWQHAEQKAIGKCQRNSGSFFCDIRFTVCSPASLDKPH
jgi:hypothetical protein